MDDERALWERQPWDTTASFDRFRRYYLPQEAPRSLNEAYRRYRSETGHEPARPNAEAPGAWRQWARGMDSKGRRKAGARTWEERAQAWDDHQAQLDAEQWEARRREIRQQDWQAGEALRELAGQILDQTPQFLKTTRRLVKGSDGAPDREVITLALDTAALFKAVELASKLQRLAAGMPDSHSEISGSVSGLSREDLAEVQQEMERWERERFGAAAGDGDARGAGTGG